jgi:Domain of unknown function (DUF4388)
VAGLDDLLGAVRAGKAGLVPEMRRLAAGEVVLVGDLAHVPPTDLLNFLHQGRQSGVLYARSEGVERALVLDDGNVSWGVSSSPAERFGEILARNGMLDREELARALKAQAGAGSTGRIGEVLVERGAFAREDLPRALRVQVVEIFLALLVARRGEFLLFGGFDRAMLPVSAGIDTEALLLDGLRRMDEMERFRARIPGPDARPRRTGKALDGGGEVPGASEIVALSDGMRTLGEIAARTALGEFETTKAVFKLLDSGHLSLSPP